MAKKNETQKNPEQEVAEVNALTEAEAEVKEEAEALAAKEAEEKAKAEAEAKAKALVSIEELASVNRVPSWQSAALNRLMGWGSGKKVAAKDYKDALNKLKTRRIGG